MAIGGGINIHVVVKVLFLVIRVIILQEYCYILHFLLGSRQDGASLPVFHLDSVADEQGNLLAFAVLRTLLFEAGDTYVDIEYHSLFQLQITVWTYHKTSFSELNAHRESKVLVELLSNLRLLLLDIVHGSLVDVAELGPRPQLINDEVLQGHEVGVGVLETGARVHQHGPHDVGAVALVPHAQGADNSSEVEVLLVRDDAELELVVAPGLDDGRVAHVHSGLVHVGAAHQFALLVVDLVLDILR